MGTSTEPLTLIDVLRTRALEEPDRKAYTFLAEGEVEAGHLTYGELNCQARGIASHLQGLAMRGDRVLLLYPPGLEFIAAFWGCLYAGVVAVPAYPPKSNRTDPRLLAILEDAEPKLALTTTPILAKLDALAANMPALKKCEWIATDRIVSDDATEWANPGIDRGALAFLQYTSGSTASPRGVVVTHGNLLHNQELIRRAFRQSRESIIVGWLPLYHDMGLIGNVLQPLYVGARCILFSPAAFLQRPLRWLQCIHRYRATTSGAPNFAYELCWRRIPEEEREGLDLSSWQVAFNGAEVVSAETLDRFAAAFEPCGFRRTAFHPCYGLAEATLMVSGGRGPEGLLVRPPLVSSGRLQQEVVIADPETGARCPPGHVGEIWVRGPSVALRYWGRPEETTETFQARLAETGEGPFLRTGDLGFLEGDEVFVTGRIKDLVIIRGRNHYPRDFELTAERSHPALRPGCGAAFSVGGEDGERLVLVYEAQRRADLAGVFDAVTRAIAEEHEVRVHDIVLLRPGAIPKTSSGKIQRRACRAAYLAGNLEAVERRGAPGVPARKELRSVLPGRDALASCEPRERTPRLESALRARMAQILCVAPTEIDPQQPLSSYGLDSVGAAELKYDLDACLGISFELASFLEDTPSLARLAGRICEDLEQPVAERVVGALTPGAARDGAPLSRGQRALWFLERLAPESAPYNLATAGHVAGAVDATALRQAFAALLERHSSLRITFGSRRGDPYQRVAERMDPDFEILDAAEWDDRALDTRLVQEAYRPFDLEAGPLFRARLFLRAAAEPVLLLTVHHLVFDFGSLEILMRELGDLYGSGAAARPGSQEELWFGDYVRWQEQRLSSAEGERLGIYWQGQLAGAPFVLDLPTDQPRPPVQTYRGSSRSLRLDAGLSGRIQALARAHRATLYTALAAAFEALLHRHTGQDDFLIGSPVADRASPGLGGMVGYFVNPMVLRADTAGDPPFAELLGRTRRAVLGGLEHAGYPMATLVERLHPSADASRSSIFQVMFALQRAKRPEDQALAAFALGLPGQPVRVGSLELRSLRLAEERSPVDLTLMMAEIGGTIAASLIFNTDLFDSATAERMLGHLGNLLRGIVADPQARLSELPLLSEGEHRQVVAEWNTGPLEPYQKDALVPDLVRRWAERGPERVAVVCGEASLSYGELDRRSDRLTAHLRSLGVAAETRVGVCLERGLDMVVGFLAILKSGGAYVPLDSSHPRERLELVVADAGVEVVLTQQELMDRLPEDLRLVRVEEDLGLGKRLAPGDIFPESLAYVIYTSGSTGRPKGVSISHEAVTWLVYNMGYIHSDERDVVGQTSNTSFDAATFEIWRTLCQGSRLVTLPREVVLSPRRLESELRGQDVTVLYLTTALFNQISAELPGAFAGLRHVLFGGEAVDPQRVRQVVESGRPERLTHMYGPTETTVFSTWHLVEQVPAGVSTLPIGRPMSNTVSYVVDRELKPVPIGVSGELLTGGDCLARGYLNRPDLTAERFLPDPFSPEAGARLYRTGDQMRWVAQGELEFVSRLDDQVKIRGFRVEPREIEAVLAQHPSVVKGLVVVRKAADGERRLVAYVVPGEGSDLDVPQLREFLRKRLPDYMVPSAFVLLTALPLTPNGKVDRKALPAPAGVRAGLGGESVAPRTPAEELLASIWCDMLGVEQIGINDDFFGLGGHSLLATQVASRVREAFGLELPLRLLFESPTIAGLADGLALLNAAAAPPILPVPRRGDLPLSFAQERLWFLDQLDPGSVQYNVPAALRLLGRLDGGALARSFTEIVRRHEVLRTRFAVAGGQPVQAIEPAWAVPLVTVDLESLPESEREGKGLELLKAEAVRPFDLSSGRLLRLLVLRLSEPEHWLMVTMHHIVSDGWSVGVLIRELASLYRGITLPELPIQYADFAVWQRSRLAGEVLERELAYWREQLADNEVLDLPTDRPRPAVPSGRGSALRMELPATLSALLRSLSREREATLFMTLLAGFQSLLSLSSGQTDICVGSPIAGRTHRVTESLIGFFVNMLVLRACGLDEGSFAELLEQVREVTLGAYAHQDLPFEKLVEELQPVRRRSHAPLFKVVLALQNAPRPELDLPDLSLGLQEIEVGTAKFDLILSLEESGGRLHGFLEYSTDLFDRPTMLRFGHQLEVLLAAAVQSPTTPVASLPLLTPWESQQVVQEWPGPLEPYRRDALVPDLVRGWAEQGPERVAVVCGEASLSYGELDRRSDRLAAHLRSLGVAAETWVGVCLERGLDLVVGFLAILKSGGAYVPLDPAHPRERLGLVVKDAGVEVVLTQQELVDRLPGGLRLVRVEEDLRLGQWLPAQAGIFPESLAYVIYTSGSTGRPKGVSISHEAVTWLVYNMGYIHSDERDVVGQTSNTSFDAATFEIWRTLCQGSRLVILPREVVLSPRRLESELRGQGVTVLYLPTALFNQISAELPGAFTGLRHVLFGGEAVDPQRVRQVVESGKPQRLTHMYGPTETTVFSTWHLVEQVPVGVSTLPIGRPMSNTVSYVVDRELKPVPIGVSGELLTGGDCLARGYLSRPDLTAERFIPDPFNLKAGARLYRTGDLMRWVAQGELEFVSRLDDQVKIRGFRVEPGEIEAVLAQHPSVVKGLVVVRQAADGERRLVAYVVPSEGSDLDVPQLREFLRKRLPDYMVPSAFVLLDALPLTPNGKVDRKALPEPEGVRAGLGVEYVAPRTPAEKLLASIWCDLLRVEQVGIHDDFFELGGHSLLATQVASRVREAFRAELPLRSFFEVHTIADLARFLSVVTWSGQPAVGAVLMEGEFEELDL
jgi:amino acid adenylation domain-containing protein